MVHVPINIMVQMVNLVSGQPCDCPSASDVILKNMDKSTHFGFLEALHEILQNIDFSL